MLSDIAFPWMRMDICDKLQLKVIRPIPMTPISLDSPKHPGKNVVGIQAIVHLLQWLWHFGMSITILQDSYTVS